MSVCHPGYYQSDPHSHFVSLMPTLCPGNSYLSTVDDYSFACMSLQRQVSYSILSSFLLTLLQFHKEVSSKRKFWSLGGVINLRAGSTSPPTPLCFFMRIWAWLVWIHIYWWFHWLVSQFDQSTVCPQFLLEEVRPWPQTQPCECDSVAEADGGIISTKLRQNWEEILQPLYTRHRFLTYPL